MRRALAMVALCGALSCSGGSSLDEIGVPIAGLQLNDVHDTFWESRGGQLHEAIDIMEPRGTPVHAVVSGTIAKLFLSKAGGITIYEFDESETFCYYYAHLDRYEPNLCEGQRVNKGQVMAYVGFTGNAVPTAPHLHLGVTKLGPEKEWWKGEAVNPYPALVRAVQKANLGLTQQ